MFAKIHTHTHISCQSVIKRTGPPSVHRQGGGALWCWKLGGGGGPGGGGGMGMGSGVGADGRPQSPLPPPLTHSLSHSPPPSLSHPPPPPPQSGSTAGYGVVAINSRGGRRASTHTLMCVREDHSISCNYPPSCPPHTHTHTLTPPPVFTAPLVTGARGFTAVNQKYNLKKKKITHTKLTHTHFQVYSTCVVTVLTQ